MGQMITLSADDAHSFGAYRADPAGTPRGGIVVIQEIFGVNSHIRDVADGYAAAGYLAVAPAVYDRVSPSVELGYTPDDMQAGMKLRADVPLDRALADVAAAATVARTAGKVATVGYCWGGLLSSAAAVNLAGTIDASVGYYGGGIAQQLLDREPRVPLLLHFGEEDHAIPLDDVEKIRVAWPAADVHVYPGAQHGFECDQRPTYHAHAARVALSRTLRFFFEQLG
jgi:carboxymethylenebutenolidase